MEPAVELTFRLLESDFVRAFRAHHGSRLRWGLDIAVAVALAAFGAHSWWSGNLDWYSVAAVVVAGIYGLMLVAIFFMIPRIIFRGEPKFREEYSLAFSPEGIHFRTAHSDSRLQWSIRRRSWTPILASFITASANSR